VIFDLNLFATKYKPRMTCLTTVLTWKWPGCLDVLAPPLSF